MSQVKNLRAMFEQKHDTSPPDKNSQALDRGRSPTGSATNPDTPTPRPLSRVRSSFIAVVEKDGRVGLKRDTSIESSTRSQSQQRRLSANTEESSVSAVSEKTGSVAHETIPESPRPPEDKMTSSAGAGTGAGAGAGSAPAPATSAPAGANSSTATNGHASSRLGAVTDQPSHNPDKHVDMETPTPKLLPADPTEKPPSRPLSATPDPVAATAKLAKAPQARALPRPIDKQPVKVQTTAAKAANKVVTKSPSLQKLPTQSAQTARTTREPVKKTTSSTTTVATDKPAAPRATATTARTTTRPAAPNPAISGAKKLTPAPVHVSPAHASSAKPKVKSPTRPVNLPSSLMAPTAASNFKTRAETRDSLLAAPGAAIGRSPSRASVTSTTTNTNKTVRRQKSSINHQRPSLGPPPKKVSEDHPLVRKDKDVDEGFLARMMRPTQASNSKVTEKAPVTPPRRGIAKITPGSASAGRSTSTSASGRKTFAKTRHEATGSPGPRAPSSVGVVSEAAEAQSPIELQAPEQNGSDEDLKETISGIESLSIKEAPAEEKPTPQPEPEAVPEIKTETETADGSAPDTEPESTIADVEETVAEVVPVDKPLTTNGAAEVECAKDDVVTEAPVDEVPADEAAQADPILAEERPDEAVPSEPSELKVEVDAEAEAKVEADAIDAKLESTGDVLVPEQPKEALQAPPAEQFNEVNKAVADDEAEVDVKAE